MPVEPTSDFCDSCGNVFKGQLEAENCPSCETLINVDASVCPICNVRLKSSKKDKKESIIPTQVEKDDKALLEKLLAWKGDEKQVEDTAEDVEEREQAMKVLRTIATVESDEVVEERIKKIGEVGKDREGFEKLRKEMLKMGKPFESILERNLMNITLIDNELEEKNEELKRLKGQKGKGIEDKKVKLEKEIGEMNKKKQAMMSYESNILMLGGAFRRLLGHQQSELFRWETDLKKRVAAFQKEVKMRKKQKEKMKNKEDTLDKREEELSNRFLDLKSRENELSAREQKLEKKLKDLKTKEVELKTWETEIESNRSNESQITPQEENKNFNKEEWLKEQRKLQADLFRVREQVTGSENGLHSMGKMNEVFNNMENNLKEREGELENLKNQLKEINAVIIEKDREIENLKDGEHEFTVDEDTKKLLKILDDLLEKLPEEVVDKFARSDDYLLYEKVLEKYKL